ncbi:MAG: BatA domain-containing protein, partial [Pirellulales bacterium]|nr:BatA domain-containing protein [Pirellulales bacterium]
MTAFVHSTLLWGLVLVALPILIHLINLLRQRRVQWAAMEFLLESQRKHRTWILLKQLLLLLLRMAALACVVLMLAQPLLRNEWSQVFGEGATHHIVLLDDSYSMSDRGSGPSAFERAKSVLVRLAAEAERQPSAQRMTVLRFSHAATTSGGTQPDLTGQLLTADVLLDLERRTEAWTISHTAATPQAAIESVSSLAQSTDADRTVAYVISDFRSKQWSDNPQLRSTLKALDDDGVQLHLVNSTDDARPNRGVTRLEPLAGTRSAGVPTYVDVDVANYSSQPAENVIVQIVIDGEPFERDVLIPKIDPFAVGTARFSFKRDSPGPVRIAAQIDDDAVPIDNIRRAVVVLDETTRALIVTPELDAADARVVYAALQTGERATGIDVTLQRPRYLREAASDELAKYAAIFAVNVPRFDDAEIIALEQYVSQGGGVAFFGGELVDPEFYNSALYRDGEGILPLPVSRARKLPVDRLETSPDVRTHINPYIAFRTSERNPLIDMVAIQYYLTSFPSWTPGKDVEVIAELRNGAPLIIVKQVGSGRVIAVMTKASSQPTRDMPAWHNWHLNPDFPGMIHKIQGFL